MSQLLQQPQGQGSGLAVPGFMTSQPAIMLPGLMARRRSDHATPIAAKIDAGQQTYPIPYQAPRMREIHMSPTTPGSGLDGVRQGRMRTLELWQTGIATLIGIDIEYDEARDHAGDDADIGIGHPGKPRPYFRFSSSAVLEIGPRDRGAFAPRPKRQYRPVQSEVIESRLCGRICHSRSH